MDDLKLGLIAYGIRRMAQATGANVASLLADCLGQKPPELNAKPFEALLGQHEPSDGPLRAVLSLVTFDKECQKPSLAYYRPERLSLSKKTIFPVNSVQAATRPDLGSLWEGFSEECRKALHPGNERGFLRFTHLLRIYAWALPCTYGEAGVSLFEQFKAVAALAHASHSLEKPAGDYLLVGGDIPGIQDFIYTITSKGAAKGLRGRSFFIQLLGDAVVRRVCHELGLSPEVNVIYAAGGNFMLLAPEDAAGDVDKVRQEVNKNLLKDFKGALYLCLASRPLPGEQIGSAAFAKDASKALKQGIARQKRQRFREEALENWASIFGSKGKGGDRYCAICQRELGEGEGTPIEEAFPSPQGPPLKCDHCAQFETLARDIAHSDLLLAVNFQPPQGASEGWQKTLYHLTGVWYGFKRRGQPLPEVASIYATNEPDFLAAAADGFIPIGNITPRISEADRKWVHKHHPELEIPHQEYIKDFTLMALQSQGIPRVGVLRMDVDDLGRALIEGLERRTMALTSALSSALELFFGGWLNVICEEVQKSTDLLPKEINREATDLLYIIYSGGDDLFIVGAWDRLPLLAERIHDEFAAFTGRNPHLHISAGLTLEQRKFPLYRAAEQAHGALDDGAKTYTRADGQRKDAITFLGQTVAWEDFAPPEKDRFGVVQGVRHLVELLDKGIPRSLLQIVQSIYGQYQRDLERNLKRRPACEQPEQLYYGRWMWMQVYQIQRLIEQQKGMEVKRDIRQLQAELMTLKRVRYSGLVARWAEYLSR